MVSPTPTSRAVLWVIAGNFALPLSAFAVAPILARELGVAGRGQVAAGLAPLLLMAAIGSLGLVDSVIFHVATRAAASGVLFLRAAAYVSLSGLALTSLVWFAAPILGSGDPEVARLIRVASLALIPLLVVGIARGVAQGEQRWGLVNVEKVVSATARFVPILALAAIGSLGAQNAVLVMAWCPVVGGLVYLSLHRCPREAPRSDHKHRLASYGLQIWLGSLAGVLLLRVDQLLMTPLAGSRELGLYVTAVNVADLILVVQASVGTVLFASDARDRLDNRIYLAGRVSTLFGVVAALGLGVTAPHWVPLLFGSEFAESVPSLLVLLVAAAIGAAGSVAGAALSARGKPGLRSAALLVAVAVNIVAIAALAPNFGAKGAAYATLASTLVSSGLNILFAWRACGLSPLALTVPRASDLTAVRETLRRRR